MRTPEQIITELKNYILTSKSFRFSNSENFVLNSLNELESTLFNQQFNEETVEEETVIEELLIEEPIVKKKPSKTSKKSKK